MTSRTFPESTGDLEQQQSSTMMSHPPSNSSNSSESTSQRTDFSFSILWSPLPVITWILPFIGHMGIADSRGYSHDFQGPYFVGSNRKAVMAFGPTTRYLKMDIGQLSSAERWDEAIREADRVYAGRMHSACTEVKAVGISFVLFSFDFSQSTFVLSQTFAATTVTRMLQRLSISCRMEEESGTWSNFASWYFSREDL